jgi:beta-lactamase regulating signal transducer with metallopeptidase domain
MTPPAAATASVWIWRATVETLGHSLWQGLAAALGLWLLLRLLPVRAPGRRYAAALAALAAVVVAGAVTFASLTPAGPLGSSPPRARPRPSRWALWVRSSAAEGKPSAPPRSELAGGEVNRAAAGRPAEGGRPVGASPPAGTALPPAPGEALGGKPWSPPTVSAATDAGQQPRGAAGPAGEWHRLLGLLYLAAVAVMMARLAWQVLPARRLTAGATRPPADWLARAEALRRTLCPRRRVRLAFTGRVGGPGVIGLLRPMVLLPASMATGLPPDALRAVLAHELAHIRRYDYLVNLLQRLVEALLFFNPAVWWISRQVRVEREAACDALAASALGSRLTAARGLSGAGERLTSGARAPAAAALVGERGRLLDRIQRLVNPAHRPLLGLRWYSLLSVLALSGAGLALLGAGTAAAVKALTPEQRMGRLVEVHRRHGPDRRSEIVPTEDNRIVITGRMRTAAGRPPPKGAEVTVTSWYTRDSGAASTKKVALQPDPDGRFRGEVPYGWVNLLAEAPGMAFTYKRLGRPEPGEGFRDVDVVVARGPRRQVRLVGPNGRPVGGVRLQCRYVPNGCPRLPGPVVSDANGIVHLRALPNVPIDAAIWHDGYEHDRRYLATDANQAEMLPFDRKIDIVLEADAPAVWTLEPSEPVTGRVVSAETHEPIADANILLAGGSPTGIGGRDPFGDHVRQLATTDRQGRFAVRTLRGGHRYLLFATAEGFGGVFLRDVRAGRRGLTVRLGPPLYISGRLTGDVDSWRDAKGRLRFIGQQDYMVRDASYRGCTRRAETTERDGHVAFRMGPFWPGKVDLKLGGRRIRTVAVGPKPLGGIALRVPTFDRPGIRDVEIRLLTPDGMPTPWGKLQISRRREDPFGGLTAEWVYPPIVDGRARVEALVGEPLVVTSDRTIGYWFPYTKVAELPPGNGPYVLDILVVPAGAVHGRVVDANGEPLKDAAVTLKADRRPAGIGRGNEPRDSDVTDEKGRFYLAPLPLGLRYSVRLRYEQGIRIAEPVVLDANNPVVRLKLRMPKGVTVAGRVLEADGTPGRAGLAINLVWHPLGTASTHSVGAGHTDGRGRFVLRNVNRDLPGFYEVAVLWTERGRPRTWHRTKRKLVFSELPMTIRLSQ